MGKEIGGSTCRQCGNRLGGGHCAERAEGPSVNSPQHPANNGKWAEFVQSMAAGKKK